MFDNSFTNPWHMPSSSPFAQDPAAHSKPKHDAFSDSVQHTQQPIMTGTSVLGVSFNGGVLLAADTLASYGSLARYDDVCRLHAFGSHTCVGAGGDISDFQELQHQMDSFTRDEFNYADGITSTASQHFEYLQNVMYRARSKADPYWNALVVGGWENTLANPDGEPFLGYVDLLGSSYKSPTVASGFGAHLAIPLMRKFVEEHPEGFDEAAAKRLLEGCLQVLFYRDARSVNKFQFATITKDGVKISEPQSVATEWEFARHV